MLAAAAVEFWGPCAWKFLHAVATTFDSDHATAYLTFFNSLQNILPCPGCRMHLQAYLKEHPVNISSKAALEKWVYDLHSDVNRRTGKDSPPFTLVQQRYTHLPDIANKSDNDIRFLLGDPFFGKYSVQAEINSTGIKETKQTDFLLYIFVGIALGWGGYYITNRSSDPQKKKLPIQQHEDQSKKLSQTEAPLSN